MKINQSSCIFIFIIALVLAAISSLTLRSQSASAQDIEAEISFSGTARTSGPPELTSTSAAVIAAVIQNSLDSRDTYDIPYPPPSPVDFRIEVSFLIGAEKYLKDARPPRAENTFTMMTGLVGGPATVTLTWNLQRFPDKYSAQLTDTETKQVIKVRSQPSYTYLQPAASSRNFSLLISTAPVPAPATATTAALAPGTPPPAPQGATEAARTLLPEFPLAFGMPTPEVIPLEPILPAPDKEEEISPISGFVMALVMVVAIVVAASYILLRLSQKGA